MTLIETYALSGGLKVGKPFIYQKYFPMPFEKYIVFHAGGGMPAKLYDYYSEVIQLLLPTLRENNIALIQIGGDKDLALPFMADLRGKTDFHQTAHLLKRASLLIGNDSCNAHFASALKTPHVILYGSTSVKNHSPQFGGEAIYIESDRKGAAASFVAEENPKTVNFIKPEQVANAALKLLGFEESIKRESLYFGPQYNTHAIELVVNTVIAPDVFAGAIMNTRLDYLFDEEILEKNLALRSCSVTTNKPVNVEMLKRYRQNVAGVLYIIEEGYDPDFVKGLMRAGIPYSLRTYLQGEELGRAKLDFFDYGLVEVREKMSKESLENFEKMTIYTKYKTNKFLLSEDKMYLGKAQWKQNKPITSLEQNSDIAQLDNPDFYADLDFAYIYNE